MKATLKQVNIHRKMSGLPPLKALPSFVYSILNKKLKAHIKTEAELLEHKFPYQSGNSLMDKKKSK